MTPLLEVTGLNVEYYDPQAPVRAVNDVSFTLGRGEILGVAGESGSGKTTLITALLRLDRPPARVTGGRAMLGDVDLMKVPQDRLRSMRWERLAIVFQSAMNALNPVHRLERQFVDVIREHRKVSKAAARERAAHLLGLVGIPADRLRAFPHEMSGGMRQRATIALALACDPELVVMDEPTTAVDVVMQRQIMRQIMRLRRELGFAVIFVTHDLSLLIEMADKIAIMYGGRIVELAHAKDLYHSPKHPYTRGLRDSFPPLHGERRQLRGIPGSPPDLRKASAGCAFEPRCAVRMEACGSTVPTLLDLDGRQVACLLHQGADHE
ncbi:ABC transporter ATP-binding protein [Nonomuraea sp. NPDC059023]|uniref:ABC transporter ATP-binding protein n=1 Tax=unclassified Nonomuraea TaxID=2593643 RepID=UPI003680DBA9